MNCLKHLQKVEEPSPFNQKGTTEDEDDQEDGNMSLLFSVSGVGKPHQGTWHQVAREIEQQVNSTYFEHIFLHNVTIRQSFKLFCAATLCEENILFYEAVEEFRALPSVLYSKQTAKRIAKWISQSRSILAILGKEFVEKLKEQSSNVHLHLFDDALSIVNQKVSKTFKQLFKKSNEYKEALKKNPSVANLTMQEWLEKRHAYPEFHEFMMSISLFDLLDFEQQVEHFRKLPTEETRSDKAQKIYKMFIDVDTAWKQVNLPIDVSEEINKLLSLKEIPFTVFHKAQQIVVKQMHLELTKSFLSSRHFEVVLSEHPELEATILAKVDITHDTHLRVDPENGVTIVHDEHPDSSSVVAKHNAVADESVPASTACEPPASEESAAQEVNSADGNTNGENESSSNPQESATHVPSDSVVQNNQGNCHQEEPNSSTGTKKEEVAAPLSPVDHAEIEERKEDDPPTTKRKQITGHKLPSYSLAELEGMYESGMVVENHLEGVITVTYKEGDVKPAYTAADLVDFDSEGVPDKPPQAGFGWT